MKLLLKCLPLLLLYSCSNGKIEYRNNRDCLTIDFYQQEGSKDIEFSKMSDSTQVEDKKEADSIVKALNIKLEEAVLKNTSKNKIISFTIKTTTELEEHSNSETTIIKL